MRPIQRCPHPKEKGKEKIVSDFKDWRLDLINCFGDYCAYCNMPLSHNRNVEHQRPQSLFPSESLVWDNLLLACGPCNLAKSDTLFDLDTHYFPDIHNTHLAFSIEERAHYDLPGERVCIPVVNPLLNKNQKIKAQKTLDDLGLQQVEQDRRKTQQVTDRRWKKRAEVYLSAKKLRYLWGTLETERQKELFLNSLKESMKIQGFFSVWFYVFEDIPAILAILLDTFPNTHKGSFDVNNYYKPICRTANDL